MASLILHYYEDLPKSTKLVQASVKYGLDLLNCAPIFNPKAESEALKTKRTKNDIRVLVIRAFATSPELDHFQASDWLVGYFPELMMTPHIGFIYTLTKTVLDAIIEVRDQFLDNFLNQFLGPLLGPFFGLIFGK